MVGVDPPTIGRCFPPTPMLNCQLPGVSTVATTAGRSISQFAPPTRSLQPQPRANPLNQPPRLAPPVHSYAPAWAQCGPSPSLADQPPIPRRPAREKKDPIDPRLASIGDVLAPGFGGIQRAVRARLPTCTWLRLDVGRLGHLGRQLQRSGPIAIPFKTIPLRSVTTSSPICQRMSVPRPPTCP